MDRRKKKILAPSLQNRSKAEYRPEATIKPRNKILTHLSATGLVVVLVLIGMQFPLFGLQGILFDMLTRLRPLPGPDQRIALIGYDDTASAHYDGLTRIPLQEMTRVLDVLKAENPKAIVVLSAINENTYSLSELELLSTHFEEVPNLFIGYTDDESLGKNASPNLHHSAKYLPGYVSRDTFSYGADSVTRRVMVSIEGIPTVFTKVAELVRGQAIGSAETGRYERFNNSLQTYINWQGPPGTYRVFSSNAIATGEFPKGYFRDKVVLFGTALNSKKGGDHIFTPYSRDHFATTALEGAANSLATLIAQNGFQRAGSLSSYLVPLIIAIITVNTVLLLSPGMGIIFVGWECLMILLVGYIFLMKKLLWIDMAHPLLVTAVSYYLVIPYRLMDEYRKRWHYQEKSEFMAQLERLKSNFLSLISHDLKTPIARIQGNAELALSESGSDKSERQKASLGAIIQTTEDLSRYVETVLDLTRVENAQVPLQKTSKDINAVVNEVVNRYRYLAQEKNIQLEVASDPLFSFKFDSRLITQVIANLVLNAIKYSPEGTTVTVKTTEENNWVKVAVQDQGIGIAGEEKALVFEKFYRCKSEKSQKEKGTGLGLYLVKYFVELHEGKVTLDSELGQGSIFTVCLPV